MENGCDLTLLDTWEFAVERRIDGEGTGFGQSVNEECNGEELLTIASLERGTPVPRPGCRWGAGESQEQKPSKGNYWQPYLAQKVPDLQISGS